MSTELINTTESTAIAGYGSAEGFELLQRIAKVFAASKIVPKTFQGNVADCIIAVNMAIRMKADPLMVMQNLYIVHGNPSWSSKFLVATVNTCGRFAPLRFRFEEKGMLGKVEYAEYEKEWETSSNGKKSCKNIAKPMVFDGSKIANIQCVAYTTEQCSNEVLESSPVSLLMAIKEGWYTKDGSKWQTMPQQMLMYRAASFWTRTYAPEIGMGLQTHEEIIDTLDMQRDERGAYVMAEPSPEMSPEDALTEELSKKRNSRTVNIEVHEPVPEVEPPLPNTKLTPAQVIQSMLDAAETVEAVTAASSQATKYYNEGGQITMAELQAFKSQITAKLKQFA